jgi:hypothetical protein
MENGDQNRRRAPVIMGRRRSLSNAPAIDLATSCDSYDELRQGMAVRDNPA